MSDTPTATAVQAPTIYFIDDSATMREVIKIAFRKENIQVVTCPSVAAAIEQFGAQRPDAVISDVIMPDRDGYELCTYVKGHAELAKIPVILMSGVVNRTVAEKATVVGADELLRKPFQPHELVARVKKLLRLDARTDAPAATPESGPGREAASPAMSLEKMFRPPAPAGAAPAAAKPAVPAAAPPPSPEARPAAAAPSAPAAPATIHRPPSPAPAAANPAAAQTARPAIPASKPAPQAPAASAVPFGSAPPPADAQRLRLEIQRLELLVRKLHSELEAERQYCQALEAHIRTLQGCD
ncbi:MAG TPA: response regulator [Candidatus Acidoferrales bacterium]|nr:response regulator [Candidatus Acidoferrales bacterium]